MDQAAVHTAVAVLKRMDIDKPKGGRRRLQDGIQITVTHTVIGGQQAGTQCFEVLRAGTDEFRQRIAKMIALTKKDAIRPQAREYKPGILDQDTVKPYDFFESERVFPGLEYRLVPPLQPVSSS